MLYQYSHLSLSVSCSPPLHHPGIDSSPAVFGVVRRTSESDVDAHSNQQVHYTVLLCVLRSSSC